MNKRKLVDRLIELEKETASLKAESDACKAELLKETEELLDSCKNKSITFNGETGKARVVLAESLNLEAPELLKAVFGKAYKDLFKEDVKVKASSAAERLLLGIYKGGYIDKTADEVIREMNLSEKTAAVIKKKVKGVDFLKDSEALQTVAGFNESDANFWAYLLTEAIIGEKFSAFLSVCGLSKNMAVSTVKAACQVNDKPKVCLIMNE